MSKLGIIQSSGFEIIRDRVGFILADEFNGQYLKTYDNDFNIKVWVERFIAFDKTELPTVNVSLASGQFSSKDVRGKDGTYTYNIDCFQFSKTDSVNDGDKKAMLRLQKLIRVCHYVLDNPVYKTLSFVPGFIGHTVVSDFNIADPNKEDSLSVVMARLTFQVRARETGELLEAFEIDGSDTQVKLHETDNGYFWSN